MDDFRIRYYEVIEKDSIKTNKYCGYQIRAQESSKMEEEVDVRNLGKATKSSWILPYSKRCVHTNFLPIMFSNNLTRSQDHTNEQAIVPFFKIAALHRSPSNPCRLRSNSKITRPALVLGTCLTVFQKNPLKRHLRQP